MENVGTYTNDINKELAAGIDKDKNIIIPADKTNSIALMMQFYMNCKMYILQS